MMMAACYKSGNENKSDDNEDKVCLLFKNDVGGSRIKSRTRSHDLWSCDYSVKVKIKSIILMNCTYLS